MKIRLILAASLLALGGCSQKQATVPLAPVSVIHQLVACMQANTCKETTQTQRIFDGETVHYVTGDFVDAGNHGSVRYFYTDSNRFGIMLIHDGNRMTVLEDWDQDGRIDHATFAVGSQVSSEAMDQRDRDFGFLQMSYADLIGFAADILPDPAKKQGGVI